MTWKEKAPDFVLLGLGALLTGLLIPYFFSQWQAYQEELEIKTSLVKQISESVVDSLASLQLLEGWTRGEVSLGNPDKDLITEFLNWQKSSANIRSELVAYFPENLVELEWNKLNHAIFDFFVLYQHNDTSKREGIIKNIYGNLSINLDNSTLNQLKARNITKEYRDTWNSLKDTMFEKSNSITDTIINSPIPVFRGV